MNYEIRQIQIKKRSFPGWLSIGILVFAFCVSFFVDLLKVPSFVKYSIDLMWVALLIIMVVSKQIKIKRNITPLILIISIWFLYVVLVYVFNYQSVFYFLWGTRNNLRFYVAFIAFASFLDEDDVISSLRFIDWLFWINIPISLYQFFILGYRQDYLGGIFGTERGCNAFTTILFAVVVTKSLLQYFEGREKTGICLLKSGFSLILAAMAELKFFFVLYIIFVIVTMMMTKFSWRKIVVLFLLAVLLSIAGQVLTILFGSNEKLTFQKIFELATSENYATSEDLGRFTAIPTISKNILTEWYDKLFGMGLGNCDTSSFSICNTPFFQTHEYLHYTWFSSAFLYLETGYIGLLLNLSFYLAIMVLAIRKQRSGQGNELFCQIGIVFAVLCLILTFYNSALRKEVGYIAYFALSLPFVCNSNDRKTETRKDRIDLLKRH